jgi:hypothetical protein
MTLYERILGERFLELFPLVQEMHRYEKQNILKGKVNIKRGSTFLAKCMNFLMRLPKEQTEAFLMLELTKHGEQEKWRRTFGIDTFSSIQYKKDELMVEKMGLVKMYFRVFEKEKALCTVLEKSGFLGLRVPTILTINISSKVEELDEKVLFSVRVSTRNGTLIIDYDGVILEDDQSIKEQKRGII